MIVVRDKELPPRLENSSFPAFSFRSPSEQVKVAREFALVKAGLLDPHQAAYCTAWSFVLNANSCEATLIYSGMGPDASTPLLTTNATKIVGVELTVPRIWVLNALLEEWDILANDPRGVQERVLGMNRSGEFFSKEQFNEDLCERRERGFWVKSFHQRWGIEWCLLYELKCLGVERDSIAIENGPAGPHLQFMYKHPTDITERARSLQFVSGLTQHWIRTLVRERKKYDFFYAKSNDQRLPYETVIGASEAVHDKGALLLGHGSTLEHYVSRDYMELDLRRVELPSPFINALKRRFNSENDEFSQYGWKLNVYRKGDIPAFDSL